MSLPLIITAGSTVGHVSDHMRLHSLAQYADAAGFNMTGYKRDVAANRPAASSSNIGMFYDASDTQVVSYSNGVVWTQVTTSAGSHTWAGAQTFNADAYFGSGHPWIDPMAVGGVGDGVANDTTAVNTALAGPTAYIPGGFNFSCGALTIPTTCVLIFGSGTLTQRTAGTNLLMGTNSTRCTIWGVNLVGINNSTPASGNSAITFITSSNVRVDSVTLTNWAYVAVQMQGCSDAWMERCTSSSCSSAVRWTGCQDYHCNFNTVRNCSNLNSIFAVAITLADSTNGNPYTFCKDGEAVGNTILTYVNAQAILCHSGQNITIGPTTIDDCLIGVSVNPFQASDITRDISISGIVFRGTNTAGALSTTGGPAVNVQGNSGGGTNSVINVTVAGCTAYNANAISQLDGSGGFVFNYLTGLTIVGLTADSCYGAGVVFSVNVLDISGGGITVKNNLTASGRNAAIYFQATGCTGIINGITIDSGASTSGIFCGGANKANAGVSVENYVVYGGAGAFSANTIGSVNGYGIYIAGDTSVAITPRVRVLVIANASPTTITNFTGGMTGQVITLKFNDGNTTINRANCQLPGSTNFVGSAGQTISLVFDGALWQAIGHETTNG